jgi:hypothetical protein
MLLLLFFSFSDTLFSDQSVGKWEKIKTTKQFEIYKRSVKGYNIDEFRAVGQAKTKIEVLGVILDDIPAYTKWIQYLEESRVVKEYSANSFVIYQKFNFKWPFDDRDCFIKVDVKKNYRKGLFIINLESINHKNYSEKEDIVRIKNLSGKIVLKYKQRALTKGTLQMRLDLEGYIPDWLNNKIAEQIPYRALRSLSKQSKKDFYIKKAKKSVYRKKIEQAIRSGYLKK